MLAGPLIDPARRQIDAHRLLALLGCTGQTRRTLAFTEIDLSMTVFSWVFGAAQMNGTCAVVSLRRLCPSFLGLPEDEALLRLRVASEAVHETGHMLGLSHCANRNCPMSFSSSPEEIDIKGAQLCDGCRVHINNPHC